jgi:hypothetical protein
VVRSRDRSAFTAERQIVMRQGAMNRTGQGEHEERLIRAFVVRSKQERLIELLAKPKRRRDILMTLLHFHDLDPRFAVHVPSAQQSSSEILKLLRARGAPADCYIVSEKRDLDGQTLALEEALDAVVGRGMGTLLSCIPGRLGYFEGEVPGRRYVLERAAA